VLAVHFAPRGPALRKMPNATVVDDSTAIVRYPVDVWFSGRRAFEARLDFGARKIERIVLDPHCRFPDKNVADNTWPRQPAPVAAAAGNPFRAPVCQG
jgi:hypothetical protein